MRNKQKPIKTLLSSAIFLALCQNVQAGGFSLYTEGSAAAIGNYAAGIAAEAGDAATGWYNPAGLVLLKKQQLLVGAVGVFPNVSLSGTSTFTTANLIEVNGPPYIYRQSFADLQTAKNAVVPSLHYALPLNDRIAVGFSIVSPFGLSTNYHATSPVRYAATLSKLETLLFSPELAGKLTEHLSVGAGLDLEYARVNYNSIIGSPAVLQTAGFAQTLLDSQSYNSGDSFGIGFHAGVMLMLNENHSRIGLNYQSGVLQQFDGRSQLNGPLADPTLNIFASDLADPNLGFTSINLYSNDIELPNVVTLSGYQDLGHKFAVLGSVVYTGWQSITSINLYNVAVGLPDGEGNISQGTVDVATPEDYRNTWRFALGLNYHVTEDWMMRIGGGYDQTPTVLAGRDVRLPDDDRWALAIGTHYQIIPSLGVDAGYAYLFANNRTNINKTLPIGTLSSYNVNALVKANAQLVGVQVVWTIDQELQTTK